jgi:hypothetical protein
MVMIARSTATVWMSTSYFLRSIDLGQSNCGNWQSWFPDFDRNGKAVGQDLHYPSTARFP